MNRLLTGTVTRSSDNGYVFTAVASTGQRASDGLEIEPNGWDLTRFKLTGSPIFYNHDYHLPIGKATRIWQEERGLMVDVKLDMNDETGLAPGIARRIKDGFLNAVSVGFRVLEGSAGRVTKAILDEVSVVSIPADEHALIVSRSHHGIPPHPHRNLQQAMRDVRGTLSPRTSADFNSIVANPQDPRHLKLRHLVQRRMHELDKTG
jgi:HK97 family phage prohead protease